MSNFIILGASGGIGTAVSRALTDQGHRILLAGRTQDSLAPLAADLNAPFQVVDATDCDQVEQCFKASGDMLGQVDGIVNCVGSVLLKPAHLTTPTEWQQTISLNLNTAFATVRSAYHVLRGAGGSIVLMSSAAARTGLPNHEAIAAAKAGVIGLMQSAAASYASRGIRVNAVAPGLTRTPMTEKIWSNEKSAAFSRGMHALGRLGEPEDVASLVMWLLQPENNWVTGQIFGVDGGLGTLRASAR